MNHVYHCESLNRGTNRTIEADVPNKVRPSRPSGEYHNTTIKGRKLA